MVVKLLFIVNPTAGNGQAGKEWPKIASLISENFHEYEISMTERPGHAIILAREGVLKGFDTIVSCGGDGTLNEVINGVAGSDVSVGLIPLGTGSDFGKTIGIRNIEDSIAALKGNKKERIDTASVTFEETGDSRLFVNILEIGFGAEVMRYVNSHNKYGRNSFLIGVLSVLMKLKKFTVKTDSGNTKEMETIEVIVANGKYFGGGMLASPNSVINDGILDVHILKPVSRLTTLFRLRNLMNGTYIAKNFSYENKVTAISFLEKGNLVEIDGEVVGITPVSIRTSSKGVSFIVP
jgi:YegS/Rv2252/BmrU family lipid kinase